MEVMYDEREQSRRRSDLDLVCWGAYWCGRARIELGRAESCEWSLAV